MRHLPQREPDPNVLVGHDTSDDAGVYKINDELAIIQTVDFFTPIVDDPYMFGAIAAANSLSDVYAMGGQPKTVMNIVGYPIKTLGNQILIDILKGAADKVKEAGAVTIGGHSIDDKEPKFGLSVTGFVHPEKIYKNVGAKPGDALIITKPIGVGILTTGIKREKVSEHQLKKVTELMATLNKAAAESLHDFHPNAVTDVTGFGLLGHANEMAKGSNVTFDLYLDAVPVLEGAYDLLIQDVIPGGSKSNHRWVAADVTYDHDLTLHDQLLLCDAVTSGGLLVSLPQEEAEDYLTKLHQSGVTEAAIIGEVTDYQNTFIRVHKANKK